MAPRFPALSTAPLLLSVIVQLSAASQPPAPPRLTLQAALAAAAESNRLLAAVRLTGAIDRAGIGVARERPNPDFTFEADRDVPRQAFGLGLPFETAGKRARRIDVATATLAHTEVLVAVVALEVRRQVRVAYFDLVAATRRVAITEELRGLAGRLRDAAAARFESGAAPRLESLQAQLALAQAENEAAAAAGRLLAARASLNTLIGRPTDTAIEPADDFDVGPPPPLDLAAALVANVDLAVLDREIAQAVAQQRLARAMQSPDPTVTGRFERDVEPDFMYGWQFETTITIPLFTRHRAAVLVGEARVTQLRAEREAILARVTGDASAALARSMAARQQFLRYRDEILPQSTEIERMAEDSYRSGQSGLVVFLQALQAGREVRLRAAEAGVDYQAAMADLERALGVPLP
ncbi:MAG: TolC family protein [Acidobacteria bacterium]|nr:TolC family protein [Acidobacteriota bacterium]